MSTTDRRTSLLAMVICGALASSSCASAPTMEGVEDLEPGATVAFGSAQVIVSGKVQDFGSFWTKNEFYLLILPQHSDEAITAPLGDDRRFYWPLEPGRYTILGYAWVEGGSRRTGPVSGYFIVPESGEDVYIGDMAFAGPKNDLEFAIQDSYGEARTVYETRFPQREGRSVAGLLKPEKRLGEYTRILAPCAEHWEVECSEQFFGVTPIGPTASTSGFPLVETTTPEFRWVACDLSGARYDVAIYRAAAYNTGGARDSYTRGHLEMYAEDVSTPYWRPTRPLDPDTRYFWSVRMRDGDTVSAWSTAVHSTFLLVYSSWSLGNWFEFMTPPAG